MTDRQLARLIRAQRPEPPRGFAVRVDARISIAMKGKEKRVKISSLLIAAALIIALLAGAAFAAKELNLFDSWLGETAIDGARERVETDLGEARGANVEMAIEEAIYDGESVAVLMRLTPNIDAALVYASWESQDLSDEIYDIREEQGEMELLGRKDGKRVIMYMPILLINGEELFASRFKTAEQPDGGALIWLQYEIAHSPDIINCEISARIDSAALPPIAFALEKGRTNACTR